jgi:hypothetical protein
MNSSFLVVCMVLGAPFLCLNELPGAPVEKTKPAAITPSNPPILAGRGRRFGMSIFSKTPEGKTGLRNAARSWDERKARVDRKEQRYALAIRQEH